MRFRGLGSYANFVDDPKLFLMCQVFEFWHLTFQTHYLVNGKRKGDTRTRFVKLAGGADYFQIAWFFLRQHLVDQRHCKNT